MLGPWGCMQRFQGACGKGLRKKHDAEPANMSGKEVLIAACKAVETR